MHTTAVVKFKPGKKKWKWPLQYQCSVLPTKLSSQLGAVQNFFQDLISQLLTSNMHITAMIDININNDNYFLCSLNNCMIFRIFTSIYKFWKNLFVGTFLGTNLINTIGKNKNILYYPQLKCCVAQLVSFYGILVKHFTFSVLLSLFSLYSPPIQEWWTYMY